MDYLNLNIMLVRLFKSFLNLFILEFKINIFFKTNRGLAGTGKGKKFPATEIRDEDGVTGWQGRGVAPAPPRWHPYFTFFFYNFSSQILKNLQL